MKQYELAIRIAQIHHLVDERKYKKALAVIQTLDMHQVRALSDLKVFAEVYTKTEQYDAAKATYLRIYRRSRTKRVLYRLIYLSIRTNSITEAESYYQEFVRMNPNVRDSLILRYRIDKAAGAPAEQLIEILQQLKQEEYIEEWAYELAKLYHRAGRRDECIEECEDIILWFGTGEIVQRARLLIEHLTEKEPMPYDDDRDFTLPKKEEPNPDDTGSLPDLDAFIREQKAKKREERKENRFFNREPEKSGEDAAGFVDDYDDNDFDSDGMAISHIARDGFQIISDLFKFGKKEDGKKEETKEEIKEEAKKETAEEKEEQKERKKAYEEEDRPDEKRRVSENLEKQSGEKKEQRPVQQGKRAQMDIQKEISEREVHGKEPVRKEATRNEVSGNEPPRKELPKEEPQKKEQKLPKYIPPSQSGTGITQDLAREISAIYEMEQREQLQEKQVAVLDEAEEDSGNLAENVVHRMTKALQKNPTKTTKTYIPFDVEEIRGDERRYEVNGPEEKTKVIEPVRDDEFLEDPDVEKYGGEEVKAGGSVSSEKKLESILEQEVAQIQQVMGEEEVDVYAEKQAERELEGKSNAEAIKELLEEKLEETDIEGQEAVTFHREEGENEEYEEALQEQTVSKAYESEETLEADEESPEEAFEKEETFTEEGSAAEEVFEEETSKEKAKEEPEEITDALEEKTEPEKIEEENEAAAADEKRPVLEGYQAPEIPVYENSYMQIPDEVSYNDLPTTRALHHSLADVLQIIRGEKEPSHFVLMGHGSEREVGVAKKIVRVVKDGGFLSVGKIAKVSAQQINTMDLMGFKSQLKGNCLLIENAADVLLPTLSIILSIMDEYEGDFVVILVDEGTTLDQLFRFTPKLAKRFKYIIDISKYSPEEYQ